ncbi:MAG: Na+:solute symporter [Calditrichaeota bacterium]|nr:Na+:solute symporter [Calditrichota bacterium]
MQILQLADFLVIIAFFIVIISISAYYARSAGKGTSEFFLSGRNLPWYLAGTAMVATTFAADTPLAVTELVALNGVGGNWLWWNLAIGSMLTVFFFSRLWRRAGIMTDVEFTEMRYSGKTAAVLRGFRALYLGLFMNAIVLGWVNKAMEKIFTVTFPGYDAFLLVVISSIVIAVYASASGLLGTARTDSFQFVFAMAGTIILAVIVVNIPAVEGLAGIKSKLAPHVLDFFPRVGKVDGSALAGGILSLSVGAFIAHIGLQWWSSWYPGADPGGGGYIAQRMMSAKDEKHSLFATLWFSIAHYAVRPWPWILVGLSALVLLPRAQSKDALQQENPEMFVRVEQAFQTKTVLSERDKEQDPAFAEFYEKYENTVDPGVMYPKLMVKYLPAGLLGLLIAVFLAAYMSTISSQLNWGTSYLINDFYKRFIRTNATEKHYVLISRLGIVLMTVFSLLITRYVLTTISGAWEFIINASAGMGAVLILRWYWWRINAWSEISAMIAPLIIYPVAHYGFGMQSPITLYPIVFGTTIIWLLVTYMTKPENEKVLISFYKKVHPGGIGWRRIQKQLPGVDIDNDFAGLFVDWIAGVVMLYSFLFSIGSYLFLEYMQGTIYMIVCLASALLIYFHIKKRGFSSLIK